MVKKNGLLAFWEPPSSQSQDASRWKRSVLIAGAVLATGLVGLAWLRFDGQSNTHLTFGRPWLLHGGSSQTGQSVEDANRGQNPAAPGLAIAGGSDGFYIPDYQEDNDVDYDELLRVEKETQSQVAEPDWNPKKFHADKQLVSLTTEDGAYFLLHYENERTYNPTIIPHPVERGKFIATARTVVDHRRDYREVTCTASFKDDVLVCEGNATDMKPTLIDKGKCDGKTKLEIYTSMEHTRGPRDARVFHGPKDTFVFFTGLATVNCLGMFLQNARVLLDAFEPKDAATLDEESVPFRKTTEVMRPPPVQVQEKNFFLFWDAQDRTYVHHDIYPNRTFTTLQDDGTVGEDLSPKSAKSDGECIEKNFPRLGEKGDFLHQGTNTLAITLCERSDKACRVDDSNTFILHIVNRKILHPGWLQYETYAVLFQRMPPFALHAVTRRPLWIRGREQKHDLSLFSLGLDDLEPGQDDYFYMNSIAWRNREQRYHGYIDDPLLISFGIHDLQSGAIDVRAGDVLQHLALC